MSKREQLMRLLRDIRAHWMQTKIERRNKRKRYLGGSI